MFPDRLGYLSDKYPREIFLKSDNTDISYFEADERVSRLAQSLFAYLSPHLKSSKKKKLDKRHPLTIALLLPPNSQYVLMVLAAYRLRCWGINLRVLPLNPHKPDLVRADEMRRAGAEFIIADPSLSPVKPQKTSISPTDLLNIPSLAMPRMTEPDNESPFIILATSGSSGKAKLAVFSWENWMKSARSGDRFLSFRHGDRWLHLLPFYHVSGMSILFRALLHGAAVVFTEKHRDGWESILKSYQVTHVSVVPSQLSEKTLNKKLLSGLKLALVGGGPIPEYLHRHIYPRSPLRPTYGLTESVAHTAIYEGPLIDKKTDQEHEKSEKGIWLKILPGRRIKTVEGEIHLHRDGLFLGYWEEGKLRQPWNERGWFASGDLGEVRGKYLWVKGRKDRQFISGGENIYPEEIENAILSAPVNISRVCVFPIPHRRWGMIPAAVLSGIEGGAIDSARSFNQLYEHLEQQIEPYKIPGEFYSLPESLSSSGVKVSYSAVAEAYRKKQLVLLFRKEG